MSDNMNFSERNNDQIKKNKRISLVTLISVYLGLWASSLIVFWLLVRETTLMMEYSVVYFFILLPIATFVISLIIGKNNYWGNWKWISSIVFGIMYMLVEYFTFNMANMVANSKINMPYPELFFVGGIISIVGLAIGTVINRKRK